MLFTKIKKFFLWLGTPIQKFLQRTGRQESLVTPEAVEQFKKLSLPGDIIVCSESGRPTSLLIKGEYDHVAIVSDLLTIVDAVGDKFINGKNIGGVRENDPYKWLYQLKHFAIIRPIMKEPDINFKAGRASRNFIGRMYDYIFSHDNENIFCSELPYLCYIKFFRSFLWYHKGDEILPQFYRDMCEEKPQHFQLIYEFKG